MVGGQGEAPLRTGDCEAPSVRVRCVCPTETAEAERGGRSHCFRGQPPASFKALSSGHHPKCLAPSAPVRPLVAVSSPHQVALLPNEQSLGLEAGEPVSSGLRWSCGDTGLSAWTPGPFIRQTGPAADFPPAPQKRPEMQQPCLKEYPLFLHPPDLNSFLQK